MNLYRYAMFIARACRGSFIGNVLFANPRMALSRCWCSGDTPYAGMYRWPIRSRRRMNRSP